MQRKRGIHAKNLAPTGGLKMYKRHTGQVSMLESPEMFGSLPLDPNNDWIKLSKLVPWREFDLKYANNFRSKKGQRAIDSRMALGALLIKPAYKCRYHQRDRDEPIPAILSWIARIPVRMSVRSQHDDQIPAADHT